MAAIKKLIEQHVFGGGGGDSEYRTRNAPNNCAQVQIGYLHASAVQLG